MRVFVCLSEVLGGLHAVLCGRSCDDLPQDPALVAVPGHPRRGGQCAVCRLHRLHALAHHRLEEQVRTNRHDVSSKRIFSPRELSVCRLGRNGIEEVKSHPWFNGLDFNNLRSMRAPHLPKGSSKIKGYLKELQVLTFIIIIISNK